MAMFKRLWILTVPAAAAMLVLLATGNVTGKDTSEEYIIGPEDVLKITLWGDKDLTGPVRVNLDGTITYKFIGRLKASGMTTYELADIISKKLSEGYIVDPQVTVQVAKYVSKKIFIIGEVNRPGTYYLTKRTTIVEAVSMAQGPTNAADPEIIIVRQDEEGKGKSITVNLQEALEGDLTQNIFIEGGDSIYVSKAKTFFIMGEVHKPGQYMLDEDTTIRKAISIAGGHTERAALNRVKVVRYVEGEEEEREVELDEMVSPLDTIVVPQSYF
jgi:polysaccharide export outer membrane protein